MLEDELHAAVKGDVVMETVKVQDLEGGESEEIIIISDDNFDIHKEEGLLYKNKSPFYIVEEALSTAFMHENDQLLHNRVP